LDGVGVMLVVDGGCFGAGHIEWQVLGVIDIDSNQLNTFDESDRVGLERVAREIASKCDWNLF